MKNFAKVNDIFQVIKVVDEILAKHLDNDKLLVAAAETMIRLNQKSEAKKVCEAGLKSKFSFFLRRLALMHLAQDVQTASIVASIPGQ